MKSLIEKQILEWKEELAKQVQTKNQAEKVLADTNNNILMIARLEYFKKMYIVMMCVMINIFFKFAIKSDFDDKIFKN